MEIKIYPLVVVKQVFEKNYLFKVLGLIGIPKLITFILTIICFPILLHALGAEQYGLFIFTVAALSLFEVLVDFGISLASGKAVAAVRACQPAAICNEFFVWVKMQAAFLAFGFLPMVLAAYMVVKDRTSFQDTTLLIVVAMSAIFNVVVNFVRTNLQSLLAFKSLSVLDTSESIIRSSGMLLVALQFPTTLALAYSTLATSVFSSLTAMILITLRLRGLQKDHSSTSTLVMQKWPGSQATIKSRIRESASFLWMRISTRLFQDAPLLIIGRILGAELVGIIGAYRKIIELVSTPFIIIGSALAVRVVEYSRKGSNLMEHLWSAVFRISSIGLPIALALFMTSDLAAHKLLPNNPNAGLMFSVLSVSIFPYILACIFPAMTDYMGGLFLRNCVVTAFAIVNIVATYWAASRGDHLLVVGCYLLIYSCMSIGYLVIAANLFAIRLHKIIPGYVFSFCGASIFAFILSFVFAVLLNSQEFINSIPLAAVMQLVAFAFTLCGFVYSNGVLRNNYSFTKILNLERSK